MDIRKIKYNGKKVEIHYEQLNQKGETDEYQIKCSDDPAESFKLALQALADDVCEICEFPDSDARKIKVLGVSISYTETSAGDSVQGAVITAAKTVATANSPLIINTPHLPFSSFSGQKNDPNPMMNYSTIDEIVKLKGEALAYIEGRRAQVGLFDGQNDTKPANENPTALPDNPGAKNRKRKK